MNQQLRTLTARRGLYFLLPCVNWQPSVSPVLDFPMPSSYFSGYHGYRWWVDTHTFRRTLLHIKTKINVIIFSMVVIFQPLLKKKTVMFDCMRYVYKHQLIIFVRGKQENFFFLVLNSHKMAYHCLGTIGFLSLTTMTNHYKFGEVKQYNLFRYDFGDKRSKALPLGSSPSVGLHSFLFSLRAVLFTCLLSSKILLVLSGEGHLPPISNSVVCHIWTFSSWSLPLPWHCLLPWQIVKITTSFKILNHNSEVTLSYKVIFFLVWEFKI